jgi:hypothetical protein
MDSIKKNKSMIQLTKEEKQMLLDLLILIADDADRDQATIRQFKWLCRVPQYGEEYTKNINIFEFQDKGIKAIEELAEARKRLILKLVS